MHKLRIDVIDPHTNRHGLEVKVWRVEVDDGFPTTSRQGEVRVELDRMKGDAIRARDRNRVQKIVLGFLLHNQHHD